MSTHRGLAKSAGVLGLLTGLSRVLGFVRDLMIAAFFGTGVGAEAFVVSFKIPNLLRDLVGEGAANSAFVPVLTECREKKREEFWTLVSTLFAGMALLLFVLSLAGVFLAPWLVRALAPGFVTSGDPGKFPLTVTLTRLIFPYLLLIGLSALAMGVLNSLKEFTSSALGPVFLNLSMIASGFFFEKRYGAAALVIGVLAGGVLQLGFQVPPLLKNGLKFTRPRWDHEGVKRIARLLVPRAMGSALYQINVFVDSILASFDRIVGLGGQSALYYSNRLFQLPLAMLGIALAQAALPTFSTQVVRGEIESFKETFSFAVRSLVLTVLPASVGLAVLAEPIIRILFQHGRFDGYSTAITSSALFFYAFGLLSCALIKILVNAFYAFHDTRTPVKVMGVCLILNIALSLILMRFLKVGGLALASSVSATVNAAMLYRQLRKKVGALDESRILKTFLKALVGSLVMGLAASVYHRHVLQPLLLGSRLSQTLFLFAGVGWSAAVYGTAIWILKTEEVKRLWPRNFL
jgi:putative peptidoglycan lipid II flippase